MGNGNGYRAPHLGGPILRAPRVWWLVEDEGSRHTQGSPGSFSLATTLLPLLCGCGARACDDCGGGWRSGGDQQPSRFSGGRTWSPSPVTYIVGRGRGLLLRPRLHRLHRHNRRASELRPMPMICSSSFR
eukprot:scaffold7681_cov135-Isochrysis_galbana.AAC.2